MDIISKMFGTAAKVRILLTFRFIATMPRALVLANLLSAVRLIWPFDVNITTSTSSEKSETGRMAATLLGLIRSSCTGQHMRQLVGTVC